MISGRVGRSTLTFASVTARREGACRGLQCRLHLAQNAFLAGKFASYGEGGMPWDSARNEVRMVDVKPGQLVRESRQAQGLSLVALGAKTGYSAAQVSRYERGIAPLTDIGVLRVFADALGIPHERFGLVAPAPQPEIRHGQMIEATTAFPRLPGPRLGSSEMHKERDQPVRRRNLLAGMAAAAAAAAVPPLAADGAAATGSTPAGQLLVARLRDAMLGLGDSDATPPADGLRIELFRAVADFDACEYTGLAVRLPRLIRAGHTATTGSRSEGDCALLARSYLLATRMLIKLDEQQLGWMAADRARQLAEICGDPLAVAESARQLAVLARKAGWHTEALTLALSAADAPVLRDVGRTGTAARGLLIQSAAYTLARRGDRDGMRELTDEAAALAQSLGGTTLLRDHGGGFSPRTVQLHRISAENHAGDPLAALDAARAIPLNALPSVERRSRYLTDIAVALDRLGRRQECVRALLTAEHHAPQETHARPAVKSLISSLLVTGPTTTELRGLAERSNVPH